MKRRNLSLSNVTGGCARRDFVKSLLGVAGALALPVRVRQDGGDASSTLHEASFYHPKAGTDQRLDE